MRGPNFQISLPCQSCSLSLLLIWFLLNIRYWVLRDCSPALTFLSHYSRFINSCWVSLEGSAFCVEMWKTQSKRTYSKWRFRSWADATLLTVPPGPAWCQPVAHLPHRFGCACHPNPFSSLRITQFLLTTWHLGKWLQPGLCSSPKACSTSCWPHSMQPIQWSSQVFLYLETAT